MSEPLMTACFGLSAYVMLASELLIRDQAEGDRRDRVLLRVNADGGSVSLLHAARLFETFYTT